MERKYFGTDGIRGTVGRGIITAEFALRLGHAVGQVLRASTGDPVVVIGKDTRISGYMLESALESGFNSAGASVVLLGPVPTPAVAHLTRALRAELGVVISASHNPHEDNGIKFFSAMGTKLPDGWELEVERALAEPPVWAGSSQLGRTRRLDDAAGRYIEFCKSTFSHDLSLRGLHIVVDAAHGAAYQIAPKVFHELGAEVTAIGCSPDGFNINADMGAAHPAALRAAVLEHGADFGIAVDGDADRLQVVDAAGQLYNGDQLLYVLALDRLWRLKGASRPPALAGIAGTLMTNLAVEHALRERGFEFVRAAVGDRHVLAALQAHGWILGGEGSGHLLILDEHTTGDGLISALQILQARVQQRKTLAELTRGLTLYPQTLLNVRLHAGLDWRHHASFQAACEQARQQLGDAGRILIRPSGTEPVLRVMVEAEDETVSRQTAEELVACLRS